MQTEGTGFTISQMCKQTNLGCICCVFQASKVYYLNFSQVTGQMLFSFCLNIMIDCIAVFHFQFLQKISSGFRFVLFNNFHHLPLFAR